MTRLSDLNGSGVLALGATLLASAAYLYWAIRGRALHQRRVLLLVSLLALALPTYASLIWAEIAHVTLLRLERPWLSWPVAGLLLYGVERLLRAPARVSPRRRAVHDSLMCTAAYAAGLAVVGVEGGMPLDRLAVIVVVDRSRSIDLVPDADGRLRRELELAEQSMREGDRIARVVFGATSSLEEPLRARSNAPGSARTEVARDATDLEIAVRRALAEVPSDAAARIVVISDGVANRGDALSAAATATASGIPIDVIPLEQAGLTDVRLVAVRLPPRATEDEPMELRVVTRSTRATEVEIRVERDGVLIRKGRAQIAAGEDVLRLREVAPGPGLHRYDVAVTALDATADLAPEDNAGSAFVQVGGAASALVMSHSAESGAPLAALLGNAGFRVSSATAVSSPADVAALAAFDLVVLVDIPAADFAPPQLQALQSYVKDLGGGVLLMGGDKSLGPGGYGKTPVEDISPVSFDIKQDRRRASLAQIIAIDYSGSMSMRVGGNTKLELANEAAARTAELLGAGDRLGVMHVDTTVRWTVPLAPVTDKAAIGSKIRGVAVGGGGIFVDLTLEAAYRALAREHVNLKHLLLFADGDDAEERASAFTLVSGAKARGITTSVVALGRGNDVSALEHMSKLGDGRFYLIEDATRLPAVFAQETVLASRSAINEVTFVPALAESGPAVRGIDFTAAPSLSGYVVTIPKARAQVHLRGPEADPILATWSVGLGRSAAFTSDYSTRWAAGWLAWEGAARLFGQVARDVARRSGDERVRVQTEAAFGQLQVRASVIGDDGRSDTFRRFDIRVAGPDGFVRQLPLEAVGTGAYSASVPLNRPGAYVTTVVDELTGKLVATSGAVMTAGEELRPTGSDRALLRRMAELSSGVVRDTMAGVFNDRDKRRFSYTSWDLWLLQLAAASLLGAVAARRLVLPESLFAHVRRRFRRRPRVKQRAPEVQVSPAAVQALKQVRERAEPRPITSSSVFTATGSPKATPPVSPPISEDISPGAQHPGAPKPPTTAEVLLARRRQRQK